MRLVTGLLAPSSGTIEVFGRRLSAAASASAQVAFLDQDHPLYRSWTVADHLRLGREMNRAWDDALGRDHLARLEIDPSRKVGRLSGGQQAQVALALVLAKRADLLVLDEPVKSLDPLARRAFMGTLLAYAAAHPTTVLLSSHVVAELERTCDHMIVLAHGRVRLAGSVEELLGRHRLVTQPDGSHRIALAEEVGAAALLDPRAELSAPTLEELVLAYLENDTAPGQPASLSVLGGA